MIERYRDSDGGWVIVPDHDSDGGWVMKRDLDFDEGQF